LSYGGPSRTLARTAAARIAQSGRNAEPGLGQRASARRVRRLGYVLSCELWTTPRDRAPLSLSSGATPIRVPASGPAEQAGGRR